MEYKNGRLILTEEDKHGFAFQPVSDERMNNEVEKLKKQQKAHFLCGVCGVIVSFLFGCFYPNQMWMITSVGSITFIGLAVLSVYVDTSNIHMFLQKQVSEYTVQIIKKLSTYKDVSYGADDTCTTKVLHPALCKDTTTGYEGVCLLPEDIYNTKETNDVITLILFPRKE